MIKAKCNNGDLVFGLSKENLTRLEKGEPIIVHLKELGLEDRRIMICYGETEKGIYDEMKEHFKIGETKIHIKNQEN